jgi:hypothetical protein
MPQLMHPHFPILIQVIQPPTSQTVGQLLKDNVIVKNQQEDIVLATIGTFDLE